MNSPTRYSPEVRDRAVRLVLEQFLVQFLVLVHRRLPPYNPAAV